MKPLLAAGARRIAYATTLAVALLSACASTAPPPDWQANAFAALNRFTAAYLDGNLRVADAEFARATAEVSRSGRVDLLARLELVRCAVQTASLVWSSCSGFAALADGAGPTERAYADFLRGRWERLDAALLPAHYQGLVAQAQREAAAASSAPPASRLLQITDPLARLVAAGALLQKEQLTPEDTGLAVDSASHQGWRRALLAWLGVQLKQAQLRLDVAGAQRIKQRIDVVLSGAKP